MMRALERLYLVGALALLCPIATWAAPVVIFDNGKTQPLTPYYESLRGEAPPPDTRRAPSGEAGLTVEDLLPIKTPEMTPGPVQTRALNSPSGAARNTIGARPLFLIGTDPLSLRWLAQHRRRLKEIGAVGMLVHAETAKDLQVIARIAQSLRIMPAPATEIARLYGLEHYPVLIWRGRIEQ